MINPWIDLPAHPPFVLPGDRAAIDAFNRDAAPRFAVRLDLVPEPYLGDPRAPIVLLNLNPGTRDPGTAVGAGVHSSRAFWERSRASLLHEPRSFPFHLLEPDLGLPGHAWWRRKLRWWIEASALDLVARRVLCVEFHPYHSHTYSSRMPRVSSQAYSFALVRDALARGAEVVVMRAEKHWLGALPELAHHPRVTRLVNRQNAWLSPTNIGERYDELVRVLRAPDP